MKKMLGLAERVRLEKSKGLRETGKIATFFIKVSNTYLGIDSGTWDVHLKRLLR